MTDNKIILFEEMHKTCSALEKEFDKIPEARVNKLLALSSYINMKHSNDMEVQLMVICTHNSRRSHIGQLWLAAAADYYQIGGIKTYSGGTEQTAFNKSAIKALLGVGFQLISKHDAKTNPTYHMAWKKETTPYLAFSKKYDHAVNPQKDFAAIMVCDEADEACPVVRGCDFRLALPYVDPKRYDGSPQEADKYAECVKQMGREALYVMYTVNNK